MKSLLIVCASAAIWLAPAAAEACGCCNNPHGGHQAATRPGPPARLGPGESRVEIPVSGMHCGHCAARVESALLKLDGVKAVDVRLSEGRAVVVFEQAKIAASRLAEAIDALGFEAGAPKEG